MDKLWNRHQALAKGTMEGTASGPLPFWDGGVKVVVGSASVNSVHCCSVTIVVQGCPILCHPWTAAL